MKNLTKKIVIFALLTGTIAMVPAVSLAAVQDEISARQRLIDEIQRQIDQYQTQIDAARGRAQTLAGEISALDARIKQTQLEIRGLGLAIDQTGAEITVTQGQVRVAQQKLDLQKSALAQYIRILDQSDQDNLTALLLRDGRLSSFFNNLKNLQDTQSKASAAIVAIKDLKTDLEERQAELEQKKTELQQLRNLQVAARQEAESNKKAKDKLLKETKGQEQRYQQLVQQSQKDIAAIREQIFYLEQNGVSVEEAVKFGQLAAAAAGIRPAFLIAILEVESGLGRNVGTGNWLKDMYNCYKKLGQPSRAEKEKAAFLQIAGELGLNPDTVRVSREPNYGCGGALGPAQFLPTTWLGYRDEVARLTGHNPPNPWSIEDAFMASAIKLARGGAGKKTRAGESAAARAYISGNPTCTKAICNYYANAALNKAAVIEKNL